MRGEGGLSVLPPSKGEEVDDNDRLMLAYGIATYANTLDHLGALRTVGESVPYIVMGRIRVELNHLVDEWSPSDLFGGDREVQQAIGEARQLLAEKGTELTILLNELGIGDDEGRSMGTS